MQIKCLKLVSALGNNGTCNLSDELFAKGSSVNWLTGGSNVQLQAVDFALGNPAMRPLVYCCAQSASTPWVEHTNHKNKPACRWKLTAISSQKAPPIVCFQWERCICKEKAGSYLLYQDRWQMVFRKKLLAFTSFTNGAWIDSLYLSAATNRRTSVSPQHEKAQKRTNPWDAPGMIWTFNHFWVNTRCWRVKRSTNWLIWC